MSSNSSRSSSLRKTTNDKHKHRSPRKRQRSSSTKEVKTSEQQSKPYPQKMEQNDLSTKLYIANLNGKESLKDNEEEIGRILKRRYEVQKIEAKRKINGDTCFAFVQFKKPQKIDRIVEEFNGYEILGHKIIVQRQKGPRNPLSTNKSSTICYRCQKAGHFARECRLSSVDSYKKGREEIKQKKDRKQKKQKKDKKSKKSKKSQKRRRSRSRDEKRKRKHRKHISSSDSYSSSPSSSSRSSSSSSNSSVSDRRASKNKRHTEKKRSPSRHTEKKMKPTIDDRSQRPREEPRKNR